jgi:hypothetical protein
MDGKILDASVFYDGVLALLKIKHVEAREIERLILGNASKVLTSLA